MSASPSQDSLTDPSTAHPTSGASASEPRRVGPPSKHQLAVVIWLAVLPTLTMLNLTIGPWLKDRNPVLRTFVLATVAVPIVIHGLMPQMHRIRVQLIHRGT